MLDAERFQAGMEIEATALGVGLAMERYRQSRLLDASARENLARAARLIRHARSGVEMTKTGWLSATPGYDLLALDYTRHAVAGGTQEIDEGVKADKELERALLALADALEEVATSGEFRADGHWTPDNIDGFWRSVFWLASARNALPTDRFEPQIALP